MADEPTTPVAANVAAARAMTGTIATARFFARVEIPDILLPSMRPTKDSADRDVVRR
ncbi:hypothetical protein [Agromyces sp. Leaf222]|uniref:hypothetical protein n=1 Tax=Agromyces sp. Leaf222 TaxID=1735688 RepID=UPI001F432FB2|nr:hypothetical protein [Agromyces sp. Leaf222]